MYASPPATADLTLDPLPIARLAGIALFVIILSGIWADGIGRPAFIFPDDAAATAVAISASPDLFRLTLAADLAKTLASITLAGLAFLLLRPAGPGLARAAMALRLTQAALLGAGLILTAGIPMALQSGSDATVLRLTELHATLRHTGLIALGLNSLLISVLLSRIHDLPRLVALGIRAAGVVYLAGTAVRFLFPDLHGLIEPAYLLPLVAETALGLWLLTRDPI